MNHAKILDCTLRDGAYLIDKKFGDTTIYGIIEGLVKAKVDFIEIGFLQDEGFGDGKTVFKNAADAERFVPADKQGCKFTLLADFSRYSIDNLDVCTGRSIDGVRECFFKHERYMAIDACKKIKEKGYRVFVQPVDILGYTDQELLELISLVNGVEPYCFSIVDTFGSMYQEDLHRLFELLDHNLISTCKLGFHSHNNMQLSSALSQEFIRVTLNRREAVIDSTISGMGRGAGNTPTELLMQYMVSKLGCAYDIDALLDTIDGYMENIRSKCSWGYNTPYFIAGSYGAHVNNIAYLTNKNSIRSKDIRFILNKIGEKARKRYDYDLLEKTYVEYLTSEIDDTASYQKLMEKMSNREVLVLLPGYTVKEKVEEIQKYIRNFDPIVVCVNFVHDELPVDFLFMSNVSRYNYWSHNKDFLDKEKIFTSNILTKPNSDTDLVVAFNKLVKCGWEYMDNSAIIFLRLLDKLPLKGIGIAGFDGYSNNNIKKNYGYGDMESRKVHENPIYLNKEITNMFTDYLENRKQNVPIRFVTESRFEKCLKSGIK